MEYTQQDSYIGTFAMVNCSDPNYFPLLHDCFQVSNTVTCKVVWENLWKANTSNLTNGIDCKLDTSKSMLSRLSSEITYWYPTRVGLLPINVTNLQGWLDLLHKMNLKKITNKILLDETELMPNCSSIQRLFSGTVESW